MGGAGGAAHCGDSCAASSTSCLPKLLETPKEIEAEMVEQVSTMAVPLTPPKMAPAETVRMKAAAIGTTCATQSVQQDGGGRRRGEGSGRGIRRWRLQEDHEAGEDKVAHPAQVLDLSDQHRHQLHAGGVSGQAAAPAEHASGKFDSRWTTSTGDSAPVYLCPRYSSAAVPAICMPSATMADDASAPPTATPLGASLSTSGALHEGTAVRRVAACTGSGRAHGRRSTVAWWSADDGQAISTAATHNAWRMKEVQKGPNRRTRPARSQDFRRHGGGHNTRTSRAASDKTQPHSRSRDHI